MKPSLNLLNSPTIDKVGIEDRIARITARSIKNEAKVQGLKLALNMIDLTTLEGADTENKVKQMCYKARHLHDEYPELPTVAAVCVYPNFVKTAVNELKDSNVKVASVATAFPSGHSSLSIKLEDTKIAIDNGADEVDMVISRGMFHKGEYDYVFDEIAEIKAILSLQINYKVENELTSQQCTELINKVFDNTQRIYNGGMRDFGAIFLIELLKREKDAVKHMSLIMVASQYRQDYQINNSLILKRENQGRKGKYGIQMED